MPRSCSYPLFLSGLLLLSAPFTSTRGQPAFQAKAASTPSPSVLRPLGPAVGEFNVVALRVEFQPDTSRFTTGDGTFASDPYEGLVSKVDPLPHDAAFFEAHLRSLTHYVDRASDGRASLNTILIPSVIRVTQPMFSYSPIGLDASSNTELAKLALFVEESWRSADATSGLNLTGLDPDRTFFVLFHAGVGRDIELVGTTLEKTPLDLPSLFFGAQKLDELGIGRLKVGGLEVSNTAVIPRTETRRGFDFFADEYFLAELSTNGLLAASFLNFLGAPDLFDTSTGESAIGPFGLMDPLGIFAYGGLLPPEPSAWTKTFLGWSDPIDIISGEDVSLSIRAASDSTASDVVRVWISESEYFMVENRYRDVGGDGLQLSVWRDGQELTESIANGDSLFNNRTIEGFSGGVVVAADDYDWSLPGGLDEDGNPLLGGALIWHVDERLVAERLSTNSVNAQSDLRGVDLEEADSGQDLGNAQRGFFGPQLELGTPFDFFFAGNPVTAITPDGNSVSLYTNQFGPGTYPDSRTNAGGPSFLSIEDFSQSAPVMSFSVRWMSESGIEPVDGWPVEIDTEVGGPVTITENEGSIVSCGEAVDRFVAVVFESGDSARLALVEPGGSTTLPQPDGLQTTAPVCTKGRLLTLTALDTYHVVEFDRFGSQTRQWEVPVPVGTYPAPTRIVLEGEVAILVFTGEAATEIVTIDVATDQVSVATVGPASTWGFVSPQLIAAGDDNEIALFRTDGTRASDSLSAEWSITSTGADLTGTPVFGRDASGLSGASVLSDGRLLLLGPQGETRTLDPADLGLGPITTGDPVAADLDGDGRLDFLVFSNNAIVAVSAGGGVVPGFPIRLETSLVGQPLVVTDSEESSKSILAAGADGYLYSFSLAQGGRLEMGFPLPVGKGISVTPAVSSAGGPGNGLLAYVASISGTVGAWNVTRYGSSDWPSRYGNSNRAFIELNVPPIAAGDRSLLVDAETYNWPNPITEGRTRFRVLATEDCTISISIVDMSGSPIDTIEPSVVRAGTPTEIAWSTEAGSGLYFARVRGRTATGREEATLVKLAIIR